VNVRCPRKMAEKSRPDYLLCVREREKRGSTCYHLSDETFNDKGKRKGRVGRDSQKAVGEGD